jgi:hypothetical protein
LQSRQAHRAAAALKEQSGRFDFVNNINALKRFFGFVSELALVLLIPWYLSCGASRKHAKESHDQPLQHFPAAD